MSGSAPDAYWSMEDGAQSSQWRPETPGIPHAYALVVNLGLGGNTDPAEPAGSDVFTGSAPVAKLLNDNQMFFPDAIYANTGRWTIQQAVYLDWESTGFNSTFTAYTASHNFNVQIFPDSGFFRITSVVLATGSTVFTVNDTITAAEVYNVPLSLVYQSNNTAGGTFTARLIAADGTVVASASSTGTGNHAVLERFNAYSTRETFGLGTLALGHVGVYTDATFDIAVDSVPAAQAMGGWVGELAHERVERLCAEEGVPVAVTATTSQAMGPQGRNTLVALVRECAVVDFGLLYEPADAAGLAYLSSSERYNLAAAITLQYDQGHIAPPWDPTDDDLGTRNDVTVSRSGGSSVRVTDETSIAAVGVYDDTISANTELDEQLAGLAGWAVNLGTVDELRWPAVKPNLMKHPALIDDWLTAELGSKLAVTGHPSPLAPQDIEQLIEGYDEVFGSFEYSVTVNLSPASGWTVAVYGVDAAATRYGAAYTVLAEDLTSSETAADVNSGGETWITTASHPSAFPLNVDIGGLTYSCTAITGSGSSYTLTLVRLATDKAHLTGTAVTVTDTARYGL
jgi:hypothetical protein